MPCITLTTPRLGNARTKEDVMAFERELLRRAASRRGDKYVDEPIQKVKICQTKPG